jgi:hypothetical protein
MGVRGHWHAAATVCPVKDPWYPLTRKLGWPMTWPDYWEKREIASTHWQSDQCALDAQPVVYSPFSKMC